MKFAVYILEIVHSSLIRKTSLATASGYTIVPVLGSQPSEKGQVVGNRMAVDHEEFKSLSLEAAGICTVLFKHSYLNMKYDKKYALMFSTYNKGFLHR